MCEHAPAWRSRPDSRVKPHVPPCSPATSRNARCDRLGLHTSGAPARVFLRSPRVSRPPPPAQLQAASSSRVWNHRLASRSPARRAYARPHTTMLAATKPTAAAPAACRSLQAPRRLRLVSRSLSTTGTAYCAAAGFLSTLEGLLCGVRGWAWRRRRGDRPARRAAAALSTRQLPSISSLPASSLPCTQRAPPGLRVPRSRARLRGRAAQLGRALRARRRRRRGQPAARPGKPQRCTTEQRSCANPPQRLLLPTLRAGRNTAMPKCPKLAAARSARRAHAHPDERIRSEP